MFKLQLVILLWGLFLVALLLVGCAQTGGEEMATVSELTAEELAAVDAPQEVLAARRSVLNFLRESANECVPPRGVIWQAVPGIAPQGFDVYRFDSEGCLMTVSYPLPETAETLYHVTLHNSVTGFCWQANVDGGGAVVATGTEAGLLPALSNAAAAYCEEQGYIYEVQDQADGLRCGVCVFDDGQSCNAWAFFQGMCSPQT